MRSPMLHDAVMASYTEKPFAFRLYSMSPMDSLRNLISCLATLCRESPTDRDPVFVCTL